MKRKLFLLPLIIFINFSAISCDGKNNNSSLSLIDSTESEEVSSNSEENESQEVDEEIISVDLNVADEKAIDLNTNTTSFDYVKNQFNALGDYFSSFSCEKVFLDDGGLKFGSSKAYGTFSFSCIKTVKKISIYGRPYQKYYNDAIHYDENAIIGVNGEYSSKSSNVTSKDDGFVFNFLPNSKDISISSKALNDMGSGRFVIFILTFTL